MGKKCCVTGCRSGYPKTAAEKAAAASPDEGKTATEKAAAASLDEEKPASASSSTDSSVGSSSEGDKVSFHKFPDALKEPDLRRQWLRAIPREH